MLNLLNTEFYKLFHSRYFWGIVTFNLFLSSVLLLDSIGETSSLFFALLRFLSSVKPPSAVPLYRMPGAAPSVFQ